MPPLDSNPRTLAEKLVSACRSSSISTVKRLLTLNPEVIELVSQQAYANSPLAIAIDQGCFEIAELLLDAGVEERGITKDDEGNTICHHATRLGRKDLLELYHCYYDNVLDQQNMYGLTSLHLACKAGDEEMTKIVLDLGADIDLPDILGDTPLHFASSYGHQSVIRLLIERGASFQTKNDRGWLAADYAFSKSLQKWMTEAFNQIYEQNKKERSRRNAEKQAASSSSAGSAAPLSLRPMPGRAASSDDASQTTEPPDTPSSISAKFGIRLTSDVSVSPTLQYKDSMGALPSSSASVGTYGTSGVSSAGPSTPPINSRLVPPVNVASPSGNALEPPESPTLPTANLGKPSSLSTPSPQSKARRSTYNESGNRSPTTETHASPFQLAKSAILSAAHSSRSK